VQDVDGTQLAGRLPDGRLDLFGHRDVGGDRQGRTALVPHRVGGPVRRLRGHVHDRDLRAVPRIRHRRGLAVVHALRTAASAEHERRAPCETPLAHEIAPSVPFCTPASSRYSSNVTATGFSPGRITPENTSPCRSTMDATSATSSPRTVPVSDVTTLAGHTPSTGSPAPDRSRAPTCLPTRARTRAESNPARRATVATAVHRSSPGRIRDDSARIRVAGVLRYGVNAGISVSAQVSLTRSTSDRTRTVASIGTVPTVVSGSRCPPRRRPRSSSQVACTWATPAPSRRPPVAEPVRTKHGPSGSTVSLK